MQESQSQLIHLTECKSTNQEIKNIIEHDALPCFSIVITDNQTNGRGQSTNSWESEPGKNLTFSMVYYPDNLTPDRQFAISAAASVAIISFLSDYIGGLSIKWPNDIYWGNKKIGGILIENAIMGSSIRYSVIGIGLNINQTHFKSNAPNPISLCLISGKEYDLKKKLYELWEELIETFGSLEDGGFHTIFKNYHAHLFRKGEQHTYRDENGTFEATILSVQEDGGLLLKRNNNVEKVYYFKEVEFVI